MQFDEDAVHDGAGIVTGCDTVGYKLDAQTIGQIIYEATGKTEPELYASVKDGE